MQQQEGAQAAWATRGCWLLAAHHEALEFVFVGVCRELGCVPAVVPRHGALDWCLSLQGSTGMLWLHYHSKLTV